MLMHTREGTTIVTQREKVTNETRQQMNKKNLKALFCSILCVVEKESLVITDGQFSFSHRTSRVGPSLLLLDTFSKSSTLPWQDTASWSFSWSFSPVTIDFQKSPSSDLIWRGTCPEFFARLAASRAKKLARLAKKLVKLDFAVYVVSTGFSEALSSFSHFS